MVGHVDQAGHGGQPRPQQRLDALPDGHLGQAAALAAVLEADADPAAVGADDGDVPAVRRDPRVSIVVTSRGSSITTSKSLTYKGRCVVHEDEAIKTWFYPALAAAVRPGDPEAAAAFVRHLDSPRRVVLEVVPEGRIGFDSTQMWRDTPDAARRD